MQKHDLGYIKDKKNQQLNPPPLTKEERRWKAEAGKIPHQSLKEYFAFKRREKKRSNRRKAAPQT